MIPVVKNTNQILIKCLTLNKYNHYNGIKKLNFSKNITRNLNQNTCILKPSLKSALKIIIIPIACLNAELNFQNQVLPTQKTSTFMLKTMK